MTLLSLLRTLAEDAADAADVRANDDTAEVVAQVRADFLKHADSLAAKTLGAIPADALTWVYDEFAPEGVEGADVWLGDRTRLRYEYRDDTERTTFRLIRECVCCGGTAVVNVTCLADLTGHLNDECWTGENP
ncbi:hypothetical protein B4N89_27280 [Embleya scabrispora]|uniref:Uncharacterized protein n=1 Tax=Embleya scabrispora TaxID=159449 RepID=A0A1T3P517_9ACTN|nr:hypothetical protein [Embleya scabrispora]OPC84134.1 hypothetical protein B4N89_27280 [Embleya scabrispora]